MIRFSLSLIFFVFISCGGEKEENKEELDAKKNPLGALVKMGVEMNKAAEKQKDRLEKGDTVAIHYEELYKFLPESFDGYTKEEPTGGTITAQGYSYSYAEVKYTNSESHKVKIAIVDYTAAFAMYSMATAMWSTGVSIDTPTEKAKGLSINENTKGWESFKKNDKEASVILGVGDRFLVTIEAENQKDTEFVKAVVQKLDLNKLASI